MRRRIIYFEAAAAHFKRHRIYYLLLSACALVGIVYGLVYAGNITRVLIVSDLKSNTLKAMVSGSVKTGGIVADNIFLFVGFTALALAFSVNIYFSVINYVIIVYRGYLIGFNAFVIVKLFGLGGIANIVFLFLPQQLCILALLVAVFAVCSRRCAANARGGFFVFRGAEYRETFSALLHIAVLMLILTALQAILIPLLSQSFLFVM